MKVGILTFPNSTSYGATLQMAALYRTVKNLGHDAEVINYFNAYMKAYKHTGSRHAMRGLRNAAKNAAKVFLHRRLVPSFRQFENQNTALFPKKAFVEKESLRFADERYDAVVCGSDQVWNPDITNYDLSFFLDFCGETTKRISYAPSFGIESLPEQLRESAARELNRFSAISVREESGRVLVEQMTGKNVPIVIDPTMLLDAEDWTRLEQAHPMGKGDYILYYTVYTSQSLMRFCRKLSEKTGLKIIVVGGNAVRKKMNRDPMLDYAVDVSPSEWLYLIHHARYVVTNSFHGTAFSINYRKNFYVEFSSPANTRLEYITSMLGLQSRVIGDRMADWSENCDYSAAEEKLSVLRNESMRYLTNALNEGVKFENKVNPHRV